MIRRLYSTVLGRGADDGGLRTYHRSGLSESQTRESMANSDECKQRRSTFCQQRHGNQNAGNSSGNQGSNGQPAGAASQNPPYQAREEGALVIGSSGPTYVLEAGKKRQIPDGETLNAIHGRNGKRYWRWNAADLTRVPVGSGYPSAKQNTQPPSRPSEVACTDADPLNYSTTEGCAKYAQVRRPDLGRTGGSGGAADYITKFAHKIVRITDGAVDLRTKLAKGYAVVWDRNQRHLSDAGKKYGHIAIVEQVEQDHIIVSQAGVGTRTDLTTYPQAWSTRMRINRDDLRDLHFIP